MKRIVGFGAIAAVLLLVSGCAQKQLFLVTQYPDDSPRVQAIAQAIVARFKRERISHELVIFNMNTRGRPTRTWGNEMAKSAVARVSAFDPDVVFVAGDDAVHYFARRIINKPWRLIYFDVKGEPADYLLTIGTNTTGVHERVPVAETYKLIKQLAPAAKRVGVIADLSLEGKAVIKQIQAHQDPVLQVASVVRAGTLQEWRDGVQMLQGAADVLVIASYGSVLEKEGNRFAVAEEDVLRMTAQANRLPDFSFWEGAVGQEGVMAAVTVPIDAQSELAAEMGVRAIAYGADVFYIRVASPRDRDRVINVARAAELGITVPNRLVKPDPARLQRRGNIVERFVALFLGDKRPEALK